MDRNVTAEVIAKEKIIVIVRDVSPVDIIPLAEAMYAGGIRLIEITFKADGSRNTETAACIRRLSESFKGRMHIGAGTVLTAEQTELACDAGAEFIISPDVFGDVIKRTRELGMISIPGALTPSEVREAVRFGADFVKLFPITSLGSEYVKAIKAPLSNVKFLAVGGINEKNMGEYIMAGVSGFGIGSNIVSKELIKNKKWDEITSLSEKYISALEECSR